MQRWILVLIVAVFAATVVILSLRKGARAAALRDDLLKRFYQCARQGQEVRPEALAGMLQMPLLRVRSALESLITDGLVLEDGAALALSPRGHGAARELVRRHRLIETYLAEKRGRPPFMLHRLADRLEHRLSDAQVDELDRSLGHPHFDPHGDPIPNGPHRAGAGASVSLALCPAGTVVDIVHVEDEPEELYRDLAERGFTPGTTLEVLANDDTGVRVTLAGRGEAQLGPLLAQQVDVEPSRLGRDELRALVRLDQVELGELARVVMLTSDLRGEGRRRLLDLGFTPGALVRPVLENALGPDPTAYLIRQSKIALRRDQARHVLVEPVDDPALGAEGEVAA